MIKTRICSRCTEKYEDYGQRSARCRPCKQISDREYYANKSKKQKRRKQDLQIKRKDEIVAWTRQVRQQSGCTDCGITDWRVLDFDHLPAFKKDFTIANASRMGYSKELIKKEINKCEVVCSNCHRIRTYNRANNGI